MFGQGSPWSWIVYLTRSALVFGTFVFGTVFAGESNSGKSAPAFLQPLSFDNPAWSPTGDWLAFSDGPRNMIYLQNAAQKTLVQVASAPSSGYAFNWSSDGGKLGFKLLIPTGQDTMPLQMPVVFHVATRELVPLCSATARAGVPSFAADGHIAYTVDQELRIVDNSGEPLRSYQLGNYANLAPISPDGTRVAFNGADERIWVLNLASGRMKAVTDQDESYHTPIWSPDSSKLVVNTVSGFLRIVEVDSGLIYDLGPGCSPSWAPDNKTVLFCQLDRIEGEGVRNADLWQARYDGTTRSKLNDGSGVQPVAARMSADGGKIAFVSVNDGLLYQASLTQAEVSTQETGTPQTNVYRLGAASKIEIDTPAARKVESAVAGLAISEATPIEPITAAQIVVSRSVPYIHQVYDTPDSFCGGWACNATAATMAIGYYQILPYWDVTCCCPYSHVSHYGRYISSVYTYNGYTYNIGSADECGNAGYGGYGYIVRNNWADTKGYMRDYFINHGLTSSVDWSPTFSKLRSEIDAQHPFVFLVDITSSGHYITAIGYFDNQYTVVFNDPYGNKNSGYMNYSGANSCYDWPGYNNGYANLIGVECYIYARGTIGNNPPYLFGDGIDGWTPGNSASGITWTGASNWRGSMYFDQTGNDCFVYSPETDISGPYGPQTVNVDFYAQNGNTAAHDMQVFWKTNAENSWTSTKSSAIVSYTAQNSWATVNLSVNNSKWWGQTINQLRLDFDNINHGNRWIVNHFVLQDALWWHFSSDVMGWTAGHSLTVPWQTSCCNWPGILVTDQNGPDAFLYSPGISGSGWPFNYLGGVNDWIVVRVYPQSGSSLVHDMAVYWIQDGDGSWNEAKSTHVTYTGQDQWIDVNLPVGLNASWPASHITQLRVDFDQSNHGNRWLVDSISTEYYGADTSSPSVPTNLAATAVAQGQVNLTWTASSDNRGVNGYRIYRDDVQIGTSVAAAYSDTNCAPATTYSYQVAAYDASGNVSGKSGSVSVTTPVGDTQAPSVPTNLTASPVSPTSVQLAWTASTDNVGVTGYDIRRDGTVIGSSTGVGYTDNGVSPTKTYTYEVRAKDAVPNYSGWSDPAMATTPSLPPVSTVVFSDGFDGNLNNWVQQTENFDYSTGANHGSLTGAGAAYLNAGGKDQMYHVLARPFAQGKVSGWFYDPKGGWKAGSCGYAYRQCLSLRDTDNATRMYLDNAFNNAGDNTQYFYRIIGAGSTGIMTAYATRNPNTSCAAAWIYFEIAVAAGGVGASPAGTTTFKVTDGAGTTTTAQNLPTDYFANGIGRITLGLGYSSTNDAYWDDISFEAMPPGIPTMGAAMVVSATEIRWSFAPADNNFFGFDVADNAGTILSPQYPATGWLNHNSANWTETGLSANTEYLRKVRAWNGTLNSTFTAAVPAWTLSVAPMTGSVTPDGASVCAGDPVVWTAVGGFGAGKVQYYKYAWDQNATHTFNGSEAVWSSGTIAKVASAAGTWYLHVQGFNAADVPNGTFDYSIEVSGCVSPTISAAVSRKIHGSTGSFDVDVKLPNAVECRKNGPTIVVVAFDQAIQQVSGTVNDVSVSSGTVSNLLVDGNQLTITMSGAIDASPLTVYFPGIRNTSGRAVADTLCFGVLAGDVTGDKKVNVFDLSAIKNNVNEPVSITDFRSDVTADGGINVFDLLATKNSLNKVITGTCP